MPDSTKYYAESDINKQKLLDLMCAKRLVLLLGSGCSLPFGYPSWQGLIKLLEAEATKVRSDLVANQINPEPFVTTSIVSDFPGRAEDVYQYILSHTGNVGPYEGIVRTSFKAEGHTGPGLVHDSLIKLPFRGRVTTNYDDLLFLAQKKASKHTPPFDVCDGTLGDAVAKFFYGLDSDGESAIAHLHGSYRDLQHLVLRRSDYKKAYEVTRESNAVKFGVQQQFLWTLLSTRPVLFVGFGIEDPFIKEVLNSVIANWGRWYGAWHFALLHKSDNPATDKTKAEDLSRRFGINAVFYDKLTDDHQGLDLILSEMEANCGISRASDSPMDWLDQVNARSAPRPSSIQLQRELDRSTLALSLQLPFSPQP